MRSSGQGSPFEIYRITSGSACDRSQQQPIVRLPRQEAHPRGFEHKKIFPPGYAVCEFGFAVSARRTNFASMMDGSSRMCCTIDASTFPSSPQARALRRRAPAPPAKGEGRDIHAQWPRAVPILPITPGTSTISRQQQRAFERSLQPDTIEQKNPRRAVLHDRAFHGQFAPAVRTVTSTVLGNPRSRRRVVSSTISPRAAAASAHSPDSLSHPARNSRRPSARRCESRGSPVRPVRRRSGCECG